MSTKCITPYMVDQNEGHIIPVPCGKCPGCLSRRVSNWTFRLFQEEKVSNSADFITLTYATDHVPITEGGQMDLNKADVQKFFKRLRKAHGTHHNSTSPIKYFAVGEYGTQSDRPHYHLLLFNAKYELVQDAWQKGQVHYGKITGGAIGYCLKYMQKPGKVGKTPNDDRQKEFQLMSKGLGKSYIENPKFQDWHKADLDNRMYVNYQGKKLAMPRYYKDKLYNDQERDHLARVHREQMQSEYVKTILELGGYYNEHGYLCEPENYHRDKSQNDLHRFNKMHKQALDGRKKI